MSYRTAARIALFFYLGAIYGTLAVARILTNALRDSGHLRTTVVISFAVAAVSAAVFIFRVSLNRSPRALAMMFGMALVYGAVIFPMESPEEKLHFIEYGLVALLAWAAMPKALEGAKRFFAAAVFTLAAGWIDEGIQALLPQRYYDLRDVGFNAAAGVMALTALGLVRWARRRAPDASLHAATDAGR